MDGGCVQAHNAFCHVVDRKCAGEHGTEHRGELWSGAGCMHLCSECLSREKAMLRKWHVLSWSWPAELIHPLDCNEWPAS